MHAPATARAGATVKVHATGVNPGRYTLILYQVVSNPPGGVATICLGKVGTGSAHGGTVKIAGRLPTRLACHQDEGETLGHITAAPGHYELAMGHFEPPAGFDGNETYLKRAITLSS
jgi:hypothetical protein